MIMTIEEVKTLLRIEDNSFDSFINMKLEILEEAITNYTNNYFVNTNTVIHDCLSFVDNKIISKNYKFTDYYYMINSNVRVTGSIMNDGVYKITGISEKELILDKTFITENNDLLKTIAIVQYPKVLKEIVAEMIDYDLNNNKNIKSETISRHSITYKDLNSLYPAEIVGKLSKFSRATF